MTVSRFRTILYTVAAIVSLAGLADATWKPTSNTCLDVSPLFGCADDSPRAQVFVVFSMLFGPGGDTGAEAPASTRNR